jgi:hypothetical protein
VKGVPGFHFEALLVVVAEPLVTLVAIRCHHFVFLLLKE